MRRQVLCCATCWPADSPVPSCRCIHRPEWFSACRPYPGCPIWRSRPTLWSSPFQPPRRSAWCRRRPAWASVAQSFWRAVLQKPARMAPGCKRISSQPPRSVAWHCVARIAWDCTFPPAAWPCSARVWCPICDVARWHSCRIPAPQRLHWQIQAGSGSAMWSLPATPRSPISRTT